MEDKYKKAIVYVVVVVVVVGLLFALSKAVKYKTHHNDCLEEIGRDYCVGEGMAFNKIKGPVGWGKEISCFDDTGFSHRWEVKVSFTGDELNNCSEVAKKKPWRK